MPPPKKSKDTFTAIEVGTILEDLRSQFRTFGEQLQVTNRRLEVIEAEVARQAERLTMVELRLTSIEARLTNLETRMTNLEDRVANLETQVAQLDTRIANLESHATDTADTLKGISDWIRRTDLDRRVTTLEQKVNLS